MDYYILQYVKNKVLVPISLFLIGTFSCWQVFLEYLRKLRKVKISGFSKTILFIINFFRTRYLNTFIYYLHFYFLYSHLDLLPSAKDILI